MKDKKTYYMSKRFLSRVLFSSILIIGGMTIAGAQAIHAISAPEAIDMAKKYNIQVKAAVANFEIQKQTNKEVTALALPKVTGTGSTTDYFSIPVTLVPADFIPG